MQITQNSSAQDANPLTRREAIPYPRFPFPARPRIAFFPNPALLVPACEFLMMRCMQRVGSGLETFLLLGRVNGLGTIWSNCLAGWLLSGGGQTGRFLAVCLGASGLYLGAMFLNDACDAASDLLVRPARPIPRGIVPPRLVYYAGLAWLTTGSALLASLGFAPAAFTILLLGAIIVYDLIHAQLKLAPALPAACRFLLYMLAGSASDNGIQGLTVWNGLALAAYVGAIGAWDRRGPSIGPPIRWPLVLLAAPFFIAVLANGPGYRLTAAFMALLLAGWIAWCLHHVFRPLNPRLQSMTSGLQAGIVLVDQLAVASPSYPLMAVFLLCFLSVLLIQQVLPET